MTGNSSGLVIRNRRVGRCCVVGPCGNGNSCFGDSKAIGVGKKPGSKVVHARTSVG